MGHGANSGFSANDGGVITPSDTVNQERVFRGIYCGGTGDIAVVMQSGKVLTFVAVPTGGILPVIGVRVNDTNTDASSLIALY